MSGNAARTPSITASVDTPPVLRIVMSAPGRAIDGDRVGLHLEAVVNVGDVAHEHGAAVDLS